MDSTTALLGYAQPLCTVPGAPVALKLSSNGPETCDVEILRVVCADIDPNGPGAAFAPQGWGRARDVAVRHQPIVAGSHGIARRVPEVAGSLVLDMLIWPTAPGQGRQCLFHWGPLRLEIAEGRLSAMAGPGRADLSVPLLKRRWYRVEMAAGPDGVTLACTMLVPVAGHPAEQRASAAGGALPAPGEPLVFAAAADGVREGRVHTRDSYNGKLEAPRLRGADGALVAAWDFAVGQTGTVAPDTGPAGCHLDLVNTPMRGATGHLWDGSVESWPRDPAQYAAIHFHDDDMTDCRWETVLEVTQIGRAHV